MAFISPAVTALADTQTGRTRTSTPKFPFAETMSTTSRFSMLALTGCAFSAPTKFLLNFSVRIAITMVASSAKNVKIIVPKPGKSLIATVNVFKSATTA